MVHQHTKQLDQMVREVRDKPAQKERQLISEREEESKPGFIRKSRVVEKIQETKKVEEQKL